MQTLSAGWALARKDLRSFLRDRTALVLSILVPIALVTVFGMIMTYAFGGGSSGMPKVRLAVADFSGTDASQEFADALSSADMLRIQKIDLSKYQLKSDAAEDPSSLADKQGRYDEEAATKSLESMVADGDAHHILVIPSDFHEKVAAEELPQLRMLRDPGRQMEDRVVQIGVMQASMSIFGGSVFTDAMDRILTDQGMDSQTVGVIRGYMDQIGGTIESFYEEEGPGEENSTEGAKVENDAEGNLGQGSQDAGDAAPAGTMDSMMEFMNELVPLETQDIAPPERSRQVTFQKAQSVAGMSVMMLLFALTSCGSVLLAEREEGTLKRLFAQPISRNSILLGKFLFVFIIGLGQMAILFSYGELLFRVGLFRDPITLLVLSLTWVLTGGAFGMFLAAISRSQKQAESLASLLILTMAALGGCWFPIQNMNLPLALEMICKSTMTYWGMTGFQSMLWYQQGWLDQKILIALCWQWGWAVVLTLTAVFFYRRNFCRG